MSLYQAIKYKFWRKFYGRDFGNETTKRYTYKGEYQEPKSSYEFEVDIYQPKGGPKNLARGAERGLFM